MSEPFIRLEKLAKVFPVSKGFLKLRSRAWLKAVDNIDLNIYAGQTLSLVGESGCGKTTTSKLILRLLTPTSGHIWHGKQDIASLKGKALHDYRCDVQAIFQDPYSSLNPRWQVKRILAEPIVCLTHMSSGERQDRIDELLSYVGLDPSIQGLYPHEFSGGQRQRLALARSLAVDPKVILLDEPISALDVSIRAGIMNLLKELQKQKGIAYLAIAHDLATVRYMSHWMAVMYLGKIVESGPSEELFEHPLHPYTQALLSAAPPSHPDIQRERIILKGDVPSPIDIPPGCRFHTRCFMASAGCSEEEPSMNEVGAEHFVACHRV